MTANEYAVQGVRLNINLYLQAWSGKFSVRVAISLARFSCLALMSGGFNNCRLKIPNNTIKRGAFLTQLREFSSSSNLILSYYLSQLDTFITASFH